jgi:hypothetical protein
MTTATEETIPLAAAGAFVFSAEYEFLDLIPAGEVEESIWGIEHDFGNVFAHRTKIAAELITVLEAVAAQDNIGCKNVACRVAMLIEDLQDQIGE